VIAESFERIYRSNLCGMGIVPCKYLATQRLSRFGERIMSTLIVIILAQ